LQWLQWLGWWINDNREWLFSGIGVTIIAIIGSVLAWLRRRRHSTRGAVQQTARSGNASQNIQAGRDVNIALATDRPLPASPALRETLAKLNWKMPDLFESLRGGLKDHPFVRDFIVVPSKDNVMGVVSYKYFRLNADEIPDLIGKVHILEGHRLIEQRGNLYRMSEAFADYLTLPPAAAARIW
jgi:hypothetical protein